nr:PREDICTED: lipid storage droplets surface-binding protein 2-like isoform X3 [Megachile rotundata]
MYCIKQPLNHQLLISFCRVESFLRTLVASVIESVACIIGYKPINYCCFIVQTVASNTIYDAAKAVMSSSLQPTIDKLHVAKESASQQASTIKEISIAKANELLNTQYGNMAVQGVDNTSLLINRLLDHYFPPVKEEEIKPAPVSADENKVLHAVQTIGQLSTKTANRVYHSVAAQLKTVNKEDVSSYISNVVSILHLTHFLSLNDKHSDKEAQSPTEEKEKDK